MGLNQPKTDKNRKYTNFKNEKLKQIKIDKTTNNH